MVYPIKPPVLFDRAETQEIEYPYRGGMGWAIRIPFTRLSLVVGMWKEKYSEEIALTRAINGRGISQGAVDWDALRYGVNYEDI
jgi:hypothetical protein